MISIDKVVKKQLNNLNNKKIVPIKEGEEMKKMKGIFVALLLSVVMLLSTSALAGATCTGSNCAGSSIENEVGQTQGQILNNAPVTNLSNQNQLSTNQGQSLVNAPVDNSSVKSENKLTTEQGQQMVFAPESNNNRSLGSLPFTAPHGIGAAEFPMTDYGHQITKFSLKTSVKFMRILTSQEVKTIKEINDGMKGAEEWESRDKKIVASPFIKRVGSYSNGRAFYMDPKEFIEKFLDPKNPRISDEHIMGIMIYNSKLSKENPVLVPHYQVRAFEDLASKGANVFIPVDQFYQGYFVPEGFEFSISGIFSIISSSFLRGGAVSPSAGVAMQRNTEFGRSGAAFVVFSIPEAILFAQPVIVKEKVEPKICDPNKIWLQIKELEQEVQKCTTYCYNNLTLRESLGIAYIDLYVCTGDKNYLNNAIYNFGVAERNYRQGGDISSHKAEAGNIIAQVYYNWAGCIRELNGRNAAMSFAATKNLERIPNGFAQ